MTTSGQMPNIKLRFTWRCLFVSLTDLLSKKVGARRRMMVYQIMGTGWIINKERGSVIRLIAAELRDNPWKWKICSIKTLSSDFVAVNYSNGLIKHGIFQNGTSGTQWTRMNDAYPESVSTGVNGEWKALFNIHQKHIDTEMMMRNPAVVDTDIRSRVFIRRTNGCKCGAMPERILRGVF